MIYYDLEEVLLKVDKMFCEERYIIAKRYLQEILEDEPGCGEVHYKLGWLYWARLNDFVKAGEHFKLALKFSPEYPLTYYSYALLLNEINDAEEISGLLTNASNIKSVNRFFIHNELGKSNEMNREFGKALEQYQLASKYAIVAFDMDQVKSNMNRIKQKMHDEFIRHAFYTEA